MKKMIISIIALYLICLTCTLIGCQPNNQKNFEFSLKSNDCYYIKSVKSTEIETIEIPTTYNGKKIKGIGNNAFENCKNLKNIIIPEGIEEIETNAFKGCENLKNISLPKSIKIIDSKAFENCNSLQYNIYENGKYLGNNINKYIALISGIDKNLSSFNINKNCSIIYDKALSDFSNLTNIDIPYQITHIGEKAFNNCSSLKSFIVPNYIKILDTSWFTNCSSLQSITLSANIEAITAEPLRGCNSFSEFNVYSTNSIFTAKDGVLYTKDLKTLLIYPIGKSNSNFDIPSYVDKISTYAFNGCQYLQSLTMWGTITTIEESAVINCHLLHTINFKGTMNEWIKLDNSNLGWDNEFSINKIYCSNGTLNRTNA